LSHQVGDLFELNVKLQCQKVNLFELYDDARTCKRQKEILPLYLSY